MQHHQPERGDENQPNFYTSSQLESTRHNRFDRAVALGLSPKVLQKSFEANQSLPLKDQGGKYKGLLAKVLRHGEADCMGHGFSASKIFPSKAFPCNLTPLTQWESDTSWTIQSFLELEEEKEPMTAAFTNPNKGICIVDAHSLQIVVANGVLCDLLGFSHNELYGRQLKSFFPHGSVQMALGEDLINKTGHSTMYSGKVVDVVGKLGHRISVSLWMKHVEIVNKYVAIMEPVHKWTGEISFTSDGNILYADREVHRIFEYDDKNLTDMPITVIIPGIVIPEIEKTDVKFPLKQHTTGQTLDGLNMPLSLFIYDADQSLLNDIQVQETEDVGYGVFSATITVFCTLSGLVVISSTGIIRSCNHHFVNLLLGYTRLDLIGKDVNMIVPHFWDSFCNTTLMGYPETADVDVVTSLLHCIDLHTPSSSPNGKRGPSPTHADDVTSDSIIPPMVTSTPVASKFKRTASKNDVLEQLGRSIETVDGLARHRNGKHIHVKYQLSYCTLDDGEIVLCMWLQRIERNGQSFNLSVSVNEKSFSSLPPTPDESCATEKSSSSFVLDDETCIEGSYSQHYATLALLGKGAYGCAKLAYRKKDGLVVVTKFILKSRVYDYNWVKTEEGVCIPREVSLLLNISHPNIVSVMDVHQNQDYVQMVMERHGVGMDLFEFVDRHPKMDEALASWLFRQASCAVLYLHNHNIIHRDIKDENMILDQHFNLKLIDFGSVAISSPGVRFSTFYGTTEFCCPEVLAGSSYAGPEMDVWALGCALYILIYWENPFFGIEETIVGDFKIPFHVSQDLTSLLKGMLTKEPTLRINVSAVNEHPWTTQPVHITMYKFQDVIKCSPEELDPPLYLTPAKAVLPPAPS